jgi:hypothetical protein
MKLFDNVTEIVRDDMEKTITSHSRVSVAAACFSMYAYKELRKQLEGIEEFRFIFTSPSFIQEDADKQKREFLISLHKKCFGLFNSYRIYVVYKILTSLLSK